MTRPPEQSGSGRGLLAAIGLILLPVICCAGPALLASGILAGVGGAVVSPWLLAPAAVLIAAGLLWRVRRCPPDTRTGQPERDLLRKH
ncbi:hypothetical protein GCM10011583_70630 [Streptomyces camponoticapitis]|uniref:Mercury transporter n=1 Tax=Streptomyces camponoticapitis TaxID=1616125 RepID=A0ABQ2EVN6_9ACTN|nr:mercury transporter [Streptomyces camponoticapitis]GGK28516.1 hypothetical protein GCM10011583_70630 [Streptomyces camponoticapitis]